MHLKSLELSGFKSFARNTKLEFPVAISAIVGPNGSGKSNVTEGVRWVLGEQSMKSLRGKRGEDLIFNGSQTAPRLGKASVSLTFDNKDKIFPFDYDEVKITRRVFRDGANEYLINNSSVRLKDVVELLSKVGLGSSSHHIISQGEADRILNASIKERRQMIEDALGLKIYQIKKTEAERKLEKTEENMSQIKSLKREIQPHLKYLKKQVEQAEEAISLKANLKKLYQEYFYLEGKFLNEESGRMKKEKGAPQEELEKVEKEMSGLSEDARVAEIKKEIDELNKDLSEKEKETGELREQRNSLEREFGRFEGMLEMEESRKKQEGDKMIPSVKVNNFIENINKNIDGCLDGGDLGDIKQKLAGIKNFIKEFLEEFKEGVLLPSSAIEEIKDKKTEVLNLLEEIRVKESNLVKSFNDVKNKIDEKKEEIRILERKRYETEGRIKELRSLLDGFRMREDNLRFWTEELERDKQEAVALVGEDVFTHGESLAEGDLSQSYRGAMKKQIERMKIKLEEAGSSSDDVLKEYDEVKNRDEFFEKELSDLEKAIVSLNELLKELEEKINMDFHAGIEKINDKFQDFFTSMFGGGNAKLSIIALKKKIKPKEDDLGGELEEDLEEDAGEGVDVSVTLPKKRISSLDMLSGGERALTSIALLFAMSQVNPPPFLILDETDAALDEANSRRYGQMLKNLSNHTQLVVVTHNRETMRQAGILYGVTMGSDSISKLLSIKFTEVEKIVT
jgi:chromosome segregation protein